MDVCANRSLKGESLPTFSTKLTILKTPISVFMASGRKDTVSEMELVRRILNEIGERGEVIESDLYPLSGSKARIRPILDRYAARGILKIRLREYGQRVPMYSFTEKGRLFHLVTMAAHDIMYAEHPFEEGDSVTGEGALDVYGALRNLYGIDE